VEQSEIPTGDRSAALPNVSYPIAQAGVAGAKTFIGLDRTGILLLFASPGSEAAE